MTLPDLVLVHGGEHAADCWDLVVTELQRQEPELRILAVDLPGRGRTPGDLATVTIGEWVDSVVADIDREAPRVAVDSGRGAGGRGVQRGECGDPVGLGPGGRAAGV